MALPVIDSCEGLHADYVTNSIREDGLLAVTRSGVVYAPGGVDRRRRHAAR